MAYQILSQKWRPKTFKFFIGHKEIISGLQYALNNNKLHNTYLFSGTRGIGKTSLARIIAKCLNCEKGISDNPCEICNICKSIQLGCFSDIIEIDAASQTKVEDIRDILDNIQYPPISGRYKIYIFDEVHMLSLHSFNALLRSLEDPPKYIKFLLTTTELKKIPITVLSRCLQFHLYPLNSFEIRKHLSYILNTENISYNDEALDSISLLADGSMRDGLTLLDQAITVGQGIVDKKSTNIMLGITKKEEIFSLIETLFNKEISLLMEKSKSLNLKNSNFFLILDFMAQAIYEINYYQLSKKIPSNGFLPEKKLILLSKFYPNHVLQIYYEIITKGKETLKNSPTIHMGFNMILLRLISLIPFEINKNFHTLPKQSLKLLNNLDKKEKNIQDNQKKNMHSVFKEQKLNLKKKNNKNKTSNLYQNLLNDKNIIFLQSEFNAVIEKKSIKNIT